MSAGEFCQEDPGPTSYHRNTHPAVCTAVFVALNGGEGRLKRHLVLESFSRSSSKKLN